jgi:hypothetical protein
MSFLASIGHAVRKWIVAPVDDKPPEDRRGRTIMQRELEETFVPYEGVQDWSDYAQRSWRQH